MPDDERILGLLPFLVTIVLIFIMAVAATMASFASCGQQPVIHCPDGFFEYNDFKNGTEHIYCLRIKYEPPETP